jgi:Ca-activated chloride channel family protein
LTAETGVDPDQPERVLGLPEPRVLAALKKAWPNDRRSANVLLVLDTSGSMTEGKRLETPSRVCRRITVVAPQDRVGLATFSDRIRPLIATAPARKSRARLRSIVSNLIADGGTAIYDATTAGVAQVGKLADASRINAVVLLTDGEDTDSTRSADQVVAARRAGRSEQARAGVHDRVLRRRDGRCREPRADRRRLGRQGVRRQDRRPRVGLQEHQLVLL